MEGFLLVDKPAGMTSHDAVDRVRRAAGIKKVGHAGTLDPFATGLLLIGAGRAATREMRRLSGLDKDYDAAFVLGARSDTDDRTGAIERVGGAGAIDRAAIERAARDFIGEIDQVPPAYAAVKIGGRKLYEAARAGETLDAPPRRVRVDAFDVTGEPEPADGDALRVPVRISCGSGTYIRALARDLGGALGTGGYVDALRRTRVGPFCIEDAVELESLDGETLRAHLVPVPGILSRLEA